MQDDARVSANVLQQLKAVLVYRQTYCNICKVLQAPVKGQEGLPEKGSGPLPHVGDGIKRPVKSESYALQIPIKMSRIQGQVVTATHLHGKLKGAGCWRRPSS